MRMIINQQESIVLLIVILLSMKVKEIKAKFCQLKISWYDQTIFKWYNKWS